MGMIISNTFIAGIATGTFLGVASTYFLVRLRDKKPDKPVVYEKGMEERYQFDDLTSEYRLIMGVRHDLKMQKGKVAAQCGHAAVAAYAKALRYDEKILRKWLKTGGTKIAVKVDSEEELLELDRCAKGKGVFSSIVRDAGQTQVAPGSRTVIAIGPAPKEILDEITGHLKLY